MANGSHEGRKQSLDVPSSMALQSWMQDLNPEDDDYTRQTSAVYDTTSTFQRWRASLRRAVRSDVFDTYIGGVIFVNSVVMVLEHSAPVSLSGVFEALEHVFLVIYLVELSVRVATQGLGCFHDHWVVVDAVLVTSGIVGMWILVPLARAGHGSAATSRVAAAMLVLRMLRLLRLVRAFRFLMRIRELWMLVQGLLSCASTMLYTSLLCTLFIYMFATIGLQVIGRHDLAVGPSADPEFQAVAEEYFGSLTSTMITLMQFLCMDSIGDIYRPLIMKDWMLGIYFSAVILVMSIVVMNLVTAVIVSAAFEPAAQDKKAQMHLKDKRRRKIAQELRRMFLDMDLDNSGRICRSEIASSSPEVQSLLCHCMKVKNIDEAFDVLDADQDHELNIDEFCSGVMQVAASEAPVELHRIERSLKHTRAQFVEFENCLNGVALRLRRMHDKVEERLSGRIEPVGEAGSKPSPPPFWAQGMIQELRELRLSLGSADDPILPELFQAKTRKPGKKMPPSLLLAAREVASVAGRVPMLELQKAKQKDNRPPPAPFVLPPTHSTTATSQPS